MKTEEIPESVKAALNHALLSDEETLRFVALAKTGNRTAVAALIKHNQRLVYSIARLFLKGLESLTIEDLMQEGSIAILDAIDEFDAAKGSFANFYTLMIRRNIVQAIAKQDRIVRLPIYLAKHLRTIKEQTLTLVDKLGRDPTSHEIISALNPQTENEYVRIVNLMGRATSSFDANFADCDESTLHHLMPSRELTPSVIFMIREQLERRLEEVQNLADAVDSLEYRYANPKGKISFFRHYGLRGHQPQTFVELGDEIGSSKQAMKIRINSVWKKLPSGLSIGGDQLKADIEAIHLLSELLDEKVAV